MSAKFDVAIVGYSDGTADTITMASPPSDRLALARALVADMPGVVVAKVPEKSYHTDYYGQPSSYRTGYNHCIAAIITAGSATDV